MKHSHFVFREKAEESGETGEMLLRQLSVFLVLAALSHMAQAKTPCEEGEAGGGYRVMNSADRSELNTDQSSVKCDDSDRLKPGWVRFEGAAGGTVMSTARPPDNRCETHAPGYLVGGHPAYEDGTVARKVCFGWKVNDCLRDVTINVRNCGNFYVYELEAVGFCKLRYCTNPSAPAPTPPAPTTAPVLPGLPSVFLEVKTRAVPGANGGKRVEVYAKCSLLEEPPKEFEIEAYWVIDGKQVPFNFSREKKNYELKELEEGFKAGTTISCQIRGRKEKGKDNPWSAYVKSNEIYTGITITPDTMTVREDEPGKPIVASVAFPIDGTGTDFTVNKDLALNVIKGGASPGDIVLSKDIITIKEKAVKSDEVIVTAVRDFVDDGTKKSEVSFTLVDDQPGESKFWEGYVVEVKKTVGKRSLDKRASSRSVDITTPSVASSPCLTCGDPHITSYDKKYYNQLRAPGDYILTSNQQRNFEVHARIHRCWSVVCNCGVAIRENNDVIKIDKCGGFPVVQQLSPEPVNGRVRVKRRNLGGRTEFRAFFTSGTEVKVLTYSWGVNLYVTSPSDDSKRTRGQCGNNNNNAGDEHKDDWTKYRLPPRQSLFDRLPEKVQLPADVCPPNSDGNYLSCTVRRPGINLNVGTDVVLTPGPLRYGGGRRKRDLTAEEEDEERFYSENDYLESEVFYDFDYSLNITKRAEELGTVPDWGTQGVTEAQAQAKCAEVLKNSGAGKACGGFDVGIDDRMKECMLDIQVTGDLSIADSAVTSMTALCVDEASRDPELLEVDEDGNLVPPANVVGAICTGDCSGKGQCKDGKCECDAGWGAEDCTIDLNKPPKVTSIQGDGLCNLDNRKCQVIRLEGSQFLESDKLTCHFKPFKFQDCQETQDGEEVQTKADLSSSVEVACPYPEADQDALPWRYYVSVSNNGVDKSEEFKTVVYHSMCHDCKDSGKCSDKVDESEACVIDGICYGRQQFKQGDVCLRCHPLMNRNKWTKNKHDEPPKFNMQETYSVCVNQSFKLDLRATDPEGTEVCFALGSGSPAGSSVTDGAFHWEVEGEKTTAAYIEGWDQCGQSRKFEIKMRIFQCKCKNGGRCLSDVEGSPECSLSRRCICPEGTSGDRCEKKG